MVTQSILLTELLNSSICQVDPLAPLSQLNPCSLAALNYSDPELGDEQGDHHSI